ncbi:hypothetical protein NDU88_010812 [Pleurodeles waltl]|uniref:Uncharacterized protein n=1 Tax=Pleurodeles waltl TaxID=8319 RepID=A0AAV7PWB3_PLEWA|nr:hypothetical protein NDU88_010812 [Pleurodeles waltl]
MCISTAAVCTANRIPRLKDRRVDSWVVMAWAYFCWRDGGGLVIASLSLTFGVADFCGCRYFGGWPVVGQNDRGGLPQPRRCYGGILSGDLHVPGLVAADTPFDINERLTVLQETQQCCDDKSSTSAATFGIRDLPTTLTGWIPKVGDLVREKIAVKKEFGPSYRAPIPVVGV